MDPPSFPTQATKEELPLRRRTPSKSPLSTPQASLIAGTGKAKIQVTVMASGSLAQIASSTDPGIQGLHRPSFQLTPVDRKSHLFSLLLGLSMET
jgi:hypothetical protein